MTIDLIDFYATHLTMLDRSQKTLRTYMTIQRYVAAASSAKSSTVANLPDWGAR